MFLLAVIAASFPTYAAPSHQEAYDAFTEKVLIVWRERGDVIAAEKFRQDPNFPADLLLERCEPRLPEEVVRPSGEIGRFAGYDCIMEVWPNTEPSFRTFGFFYHDGFEWVYSGAVYGRKIPALEQFQPLKNEGDFILKDGAQNYDGYPNSPFYNDYDPYKKLFELDEQYDTSNY
jgi:hypothetical protein